MPRFEMRIDAEFDAELKAAQRVDKLPRAHVIRLATRAELKRRARHDEALRREIAREKKALNGNGRKLKKAA